MSTGAKGLFVARLPDPVYNSRVVLLVGPAKDATAFLKQTWKDCPDICSQGSLIYNGHRYAVYMHRWIPDPDDRCTLAHEICHLVRHIMENIGSKGKGSNEPAAYLTGYFTKAAYRALARLEKARAKKETTHDNV